MADTNASATDASRRSQSTLPSEGINDGSRFQKRSRDPASHNHSGNSNSNSNSNHNNRRRGGGSRNVGSRRPRDQPYRPYKRLRVGNEPRPEPGENHPFTAEEIAAETRRPKHKVAVMIGYSGTGYRGMQINAPERTIEGDLFNAFVAAGAISRANADDHRKSSLVRCARTDKGVHAAGNVISLKLIIEDGANAVKDRINEALPPQIRVWGIQKTSGGFSAYQACDSRWYEYLLPSYSLLTPHPDSFMWKELVDAARKNGVYDDFGKQVEDVKGFWESVDKTDIKPILNRLGPEVRAPVLEHMHASQETFGSGSDRPEERRPPTPPVQANPNSPRLAPTQPAEGREETETEPAPTKSMPVDPPVDEPNSDDANVDMAPAATELTPVELALRDVKAAYVAAKRRWRVTPERMQRLQANLNEFCGTNNFFNYTVAKAHGESSAKRHIRSFTLDPKPIIIGNTEWLSLKVHGQSFMMHQIRKMIGAAALMVRCATPAERIQQTYEDRRIAIPKAPGLGLLLERPVFDTYNKKAKEELHKEEINFDKYPEIEAFKKEYIYNRIFEVEEKDNTFHGFFTHVDNFRSDYFLWLTANGITDNMIRPSKELEIKEANEDEDEDPENGQG